MRTDTARPARLPSIDKTVRKGLNGAGTELIDSASRARGAGLYRPRPFEARARVRRWWAQVLGPN